MKQTFIHYNILSNTCTLNSLFLWHYNTVHLVWACHVWISTSSEESDFTLLFLHDPDHTWPLPYLLVPVHQLSFQIPGSSPPRQTSSFLGRSGLNTSSDLQQKQHWMAKKINLQLILRFLQKVLSICHSHHTSGQPEVDRWSWLFPTAAWPIVHSATCPGPHFAGPTLAKYCIVVSTVRICDYPKG